ncbi:hypothetical protein OSB04_015328 [Centaurea solstitialis]|uniref:BHLH domain-containing protein n=1 Tax=Centaurea solstitialis TaxID=347529 RepID=A0AA38T6M9_9ASTR|nr:hypothetical protein OSB04_015328 [Centaurea solstitialis]
MDSIFNLQETERSNLLQQMIDSFGCTYVCLWSHFPHPSNCLIFIDGVYKNENNQASSSSGSLGIRSFLDYQKSTFLIDDYSGRVPGFAFKNNLPYMERKGVELLRLASNAQQLQFYQVIALHKLIKFLLCFWQLGLRLVLQTAIFMGCKNGEIELGMSNGTSQTDFEIKLKKLFPGDFPQEMLPQQLDHARPSSSSSSLRSLSIENSSEYSPFLFNMLQTTSYMPDTIFGPKEAFLDQQAPNQTPSSSTIRSQDPLQHVLDQIRSNQLMPLRENEEATMTRAILAAISSSPSPPSSSSSHQLQTPLRVVNSAFKRYRSCLGPTKQRMPISRQNLTRRSLSFFRNLSDLQARAQQDRMYQTTRPTTNQLHHMISERKRREKLNESFQALRSLLPSGSKKDKASVLSNTKEYIASLKSQVEELNKRNKILEGQNSGRLEAINQDSGERLTVGIRNVGASSSESRVVELEVHVRGDLILTDLVIRILEFIKRVEHATVVSLDAGTRTLENDVLANRVVLRLKIQVYIFINKYYIGVSY